MSLDDPILNTTFLNLALDSYATRESILSNHHLLSPLFTPKHILRQYPKIRMLIAGQDPLRDD